MERSMIITMSLAVVLGTVVGVLSKTYAWF